MTQIDKPNAETKGERALPMLRRHVDSIADFAGSTIGHLPYSESNHFAFMALCFVSRQIEHASTIRRLIPHRDAALPARSMTEGLIQLLWAEREPQSRGLQWRSYAWVHDWRLSRRQVAQGHLPTSDQTQKVNEGLATFGHQFLTKKARLAATTKVTNPNASSDNPTADPYHRNWRCGTTLSSMSSEAGAEALYDELYGPLSDWEHWGPEGIGYGLQRGSDSVKYVAESYSVAAHSLAVAFQCLHRSMQVLDAHLRLDISMRLDTMRDAYVTDHETELANTVRTG